MEKGWRFAVIWNYNQHFLLAKKGYSIFVLSHVSECLVTFAAY